MASSKRSRSTSLSTTTTAATESMGKITAFVEEELTVVWDKIEAWRQDNHFIRSGYRPTSNSYAKSAASLKYLHNESVNIWSHLVPAVLLAGYGPILIRKLNIRYGDATNQDLLAFVCYFLGAVICLGMSATYHTISNHSQAVSKYGNKLDYLGIIFLILGSFVPSIYYGFACDPKLIHRYLSMITTIGAGCAVVSLSHRFASPKWRPFRAIMFVGMGISAVVPVIHGLQLYGISRMVDLIALPWLVAQGSMYVIGAAIYALRVPESLKPGHFDLFGSSHQIFHLLVVAAALTHLTGLIKAFDYHHQNSHAARCLL